MGYTPISLREADGTPVFPYNIGRAYYGTLPEDLQQFGSKYYSIC